MAVNIRTARDAVGLSQEGLARAIDVTLRTVTGWELSEQMPRTRHLLRLSALFERDLAWFWTDHDHNGESAAA